VGGKLTAPLAAIFRDRSRPASIHTVATDILADYAGDDPDLIADLLMDADPESYGAFFGIALKQQSRTLTLLKAEIARKEGATDSGNDSETVKDRLARRQARAAVALLRMGKASEIMPLLCHSPDPRLRSFIVNRLGPLGADPRILAAELARIDSPATHHPPPATQLMDAVLFHPATSIRRALILAIGTYGTERLAAGDREPLVGKLVDLFRNDPDAGIHGAAEWTLRQWKQQAKLTSLDAESSKLKNRGNRRWYVNSHGQTFAVIEGPVEFRMGSPPTELYRENDDILHRCLIPRRFAIAAKELTVEQYREFVAEHPGGDCADNDLYSPDTNGPMNMLNWYHAAAYCNWLSRKEGLPECYEPNPEGKYAAGMKIKSDALRLGGYRLPTEAEWEYACQAGAETSRPYGASQDLLGRYAWFISTSQDRAWPCGSLQPNDLGLFDMLGNIFEWCQDRYMPPRASPSSMITDGLDATDMVDDKTNRPLRGWSFPDRPMYVRTEHRLWKNPADRVTNVGFRLARTCP
jgi:formylglycine-generating enzyme required for sulfatase activity